MDITDLLTLMGGNQGKEVFDILSSLENGSDKTELLTKLLGKNNPQINTIMNLYGNKKRQPPGLNAIKKFASNEIIGALLRYFLR